MDSQNINKEGVAQKSHFSNYNISITVFMNDPLLEKYGETPDTLLDNEQVLKAVLYKYGIDIEKEYSFEICLHRNTFGKVVMAPLFMGVERTDYGWLYLKRNLEKYRV